jgi:hypothetical protein
MPGIKVGRGGLVAMGNGLKQSVMVCAERFPNRISGLANAGIWKKMAF